jgi:hypothetical protein
MTLKISIFHRIFYIYTIYKICQTVVEAVAAVKAVSVAAVSVAAVSVAAVSVAAVRVARVVVKEAITTCSTRKKSPVLKARV